MLIVNADDWGRSAEDTAAALRCFEAGRISSASAMVYMPDSKRAAVIATATGIDVGLHLNLSEPFGCPSTPPIIREAQGRISGFLQIGRYAQIFYNPLLRREFALVVRAQIEEFGRLFPKPPTHFDGHQHLHLCSNLLFNLPFPAGQKVRRSFSFMRGEKSALNRAYRSWVDRRLTKSYKTTDFFFALSSSLENNSISRVIDLAKGCTVELMTHPRVQAEYDYLLSKDFGAHLSLVSLRSHSTESPG